MSKKKPPELHPDDLEKIVTALADQARAFQEELASRYAARLDELREGIERLSSRLDELEHQPVPKPDLGAVQRYGPDAFRLRVPELAGGERTTDLELRGTERIRIRLSRHELVIEALDG